MIKDLLKQTEVFVNGEKIMVEDDVEDIYDGIDEDDVDIDDLINDIVVSETDGPSITSRELPAEQKSKEIDLDEKHSLANKIVDNSLDVIKNAKLVFTSFSDDVIHGKDRSTSSKEMLIKALEVQNQANKNLIDLSRSLEGNNGNTNILIASSISPKKSGIDPDNIKSHFGR
jgi:hypothetical protein